MALLVVGETRCGHRTFFLQICSLEQVQLDQQLRKFKILLGCEYVFVGLDVVQTWDSNQPLI